MERLRLDFAQHHAIVGLGVDPKGKKHLLGVCEGATENAAIVSGLLEDLVWPGRAIHAHR